MIADLEIEAMIADLDKGVDLVWKPAMKNTLFAAWRDQHDCPLAPWSFSEAKLLPIDAFPTGSIEKQAEFYIAEWTEE